MKAYVSEIYSAIQGEGEYLGLRQIFVRFCGCNINCSYCDTVREADYGRIEKKAGSRKFVKFKNPITKDKLFNIIKQINKDKHHSVSITGGEPLLHADFLKTFLPYLKKEKLKIYLETNGILRKELKKIIKLVDIIAMDIKLPSVTGEKSFWEEHKKFLDIALKNKKEIFVKIVVGKNISSADLKKTSALCAGRKVVIILQPVSEKNAPSLKKLVLWQKELLKKHEAVKIIPQVHKLMGEI
ncbi:MAG: 7-carboxy-7-deazaguanine synthase QueE [Armatimonadota bacterium]